jgi:hypothetical protein
MLVKDLINESISYNADGTIKTIRKRYRLYSDSGFYLRKKDTNI